MTPDPHTVLFYDVETSGFTRSRLVELGMQLVNVKTKTLLMELSIIVKPVGFVIEQGAIAVHGITQAEAEHYGAPVDVALSLFTHLRQRASLVVCHNLSHDYRVMDGELSHCGWPALNQSSTPFFCTMLGMTPIAKLPASEKQKRAGFGGFKKPSLAEAYRFCFGRDFPNAHRALADVRPTAEIFMWMHDNGHVGPSAQGSTVTVEVRPQLASGIHADMGGIAPPPPPPSMVPLHTFMPIIGYPPLPLPPSGLTNDIPF